MDVDAIKVAKLTKEERDRCMREGLCLRCRKKGHMARNCPTFQQKPTATVRKVKEYTPTIETFDEEVTVGKVAIAIKKDF
jgi:hypothetical protein